MAAAASRAPVPFRPAQLSRLAADGAEDDGDLGSAAVAADRLRPKVLGHLLLLAIVACFASFLAWAAWASIDEVTHGDGRVIPSRQLQVVQNLEGGIIAAILAREGAVVEEGQVLMRIDNVRAGTEFREKKARHTALLAAAARLEAEIERRGEISFPPEVLAEAPEAARNEVALFRSRKENLASETDILKRQAEQRGQELKELRSKLAQLDRSNKLSQEELRLVEGVASGGAVARGDFLRIRRQANDTRGNSTRPGWRSRAPRPRWRR
jgi:adhesin transport system membrane fusion protein